MASGTQERWEAYGKDALEGIKAAPARFLVNALPRARLPIRQDLMKQLGDLRGKAVLDLGCGRGEFSIWLAKLGARVTAVDLGAPLLEAARSRAALNGVSCDFQQADIVSLPFPAGTFDAVIGLSILHHLSQADVRRAVAECHRVLRENGSAFFTEPVENSRVFDLIQNLLPAPGEPARPSILQRAKWKKWLAGLDDRVMSDSELRSAGTAFSEIHLRHHGLTIRLARLFGHEWTARLGRLDRWLLETLPWLARYSQSALVRYIK